MSNTAEKVWTLYKDLSYSDSEEEFTVKDDIMKYQRNEEENNYDNIVLYPYYNKCNKFHKRKQM